MGNRTGIAWTDATWNPVTGCTPVSAGCERCYARTMAKRLVAAGASGYDLVGFNPTYHPSRMRQPLEWRRPRMVFVCSMGDVFHPHITDAQISGIYHVMRRGVDERGHRFQVLTKRAGRMAEFVRPLGRMGHLRGIWHGITVENEAVLDRLELLHAVEGTVRFVSAEPLVGRIRGVAKRLRDARVDWIIIGGESGAGARLARLEWIRELICDAHEAGCSVFVKQLGTAAAQNLGLPGKGGDIGLWPDDLRVREFPTGVL